MAIGLFNIWTFIEICSVYLLVQLTGIDAFSCYSCTYTLTGDPSLNFECANQPWNATTGSPIIQCNTGYCVTKVVYNKEKTIMSIDRGCRMPENMDCGVNCCNENWHSNVCQYQCAESQQTAPCNSRDVSTAPQANRGKGGGTGEANNTKQSLTLVLIGLLLFAIA